MAPFTTISGEPSGSGEDESKKRKVNKAIDKHLTRLCLLYDESAVADKKQRIRGVGTLDQMEGLIVATAEPLQVDRRNRIKFTGTTAGQVIGSIPHVADAVQWKAKPDLKKKIYGSARVAVGGRTPGAT